MNPYANEIILIGKNNGSTAAEMLGWLTMPNFYLGNKTPYDILHDEFSKAEKEFSHVLGAFSKDYKDNTGRSIEHNLRDDKNGLYRFLGV